MSESEVVFRIVDRVGNLHRVTAARVVSEVERTVIFYSAARNEVATFVDPIAVTLDTPESIDHRPLLPVDACSAVLSADYCLAPPPLWVIGLSLASLVALQALDLFGFFEWLGR
jgi:hypothetical protein